jgi:HNH endonuclease
MIKTEALSGQALHYVQFWYYEVCKQNPCAIAIVEHFQQLHRSGDRPAYKYSADDIASITANCSMSEVQAAIKNLVKQGFFTRGKGTAIFLGVLHRAIAVHPTPAEILAGIHQEMEAIAAIRGYRKLMDYEVPRNTEYLKHRDEVLARDGSKCVYCQSSKNLSLDHVFPQSRGGKHTPDNLVICCKTCNSREGARTPQEWLRGVL